LAAIYYVLGAKQHTRVIASTGGPGRLRKEPIVIRDLPDLYRGIVSGRLGD